MQKYDIYFDIKHRSNSASEGVTNLVLPSAPRPLKLPKSFRKASPKLPPNQHPSSVFGKKNLSCRPIQRSSPLLFFDMDRLSRLKNPKQRCQRNDVARRIAICWNGTEPVTICGTHYLGVKKKHIVYIYIYIYRYKCIEIYTCTYIIYIYT